MKLLFPALVALVLAACGPAEQPPPPESRPADTELTGSVTCRECHEAFYEKWATSHHGLAMQPFTARFAEENLRPQARPVTIADLTYTADLAGAVIEKGPGGERRYPIEHVMGGKNVYYFLTPMERGRLQVLPVAFDVAAGRWYDTAASGVRHFRDRPPDEPLRWTDPAYTFNTSCYSCHVSQLSRNYDPKTDTYHTTWAEPGINCETCHGPGAAHVRVCRAAPDGEPPADLKIIRTADFTVARQNDTCAPCHAKMSPISTAFTPGDRYFDHFDLVTVEHVDFYPDGRDLGENYTLTTWLMSPCVKSGKLSCTHCHTSSGRYRFAEPAVADNACLPCHEQRVADPVPHTHHPKTDKPGSRCIDCHMPKTRFANMARSDHSMLPPTPAATIAFASPNACNLCHTKKQEDAAWADALVRRWHRDDYQAPVLARAQLVAAARKGDWTDLPAMLAFITDPQRDTVFKTGLIRLLADCPDRRAPDALVTALKDPAPLVRSAAASGLKDNPAPPIVQALLDATEDDYRLVRIRAANALASYPRQRLDTADRARLARATGELEDSLRCRLDDWTAHYNRGNYLSDRGDPQGALAAYREAIRLRPDALMPHVNAAMVYARQGRPDRAEKHLTAALALAPKNAAANFNMGLLQAEKKNFKKAQKHLRAALKAQPDMAQAAYNLGLLLAADRPDEGIAMLRKASALCPHAPRYGYSLAFYLDRSGDHAGACRVLEDLIDRHGDYGDAYLLLAGIYEKRKQPGKARAVYRRALESKRLPPRARMHIESRLRATGES